MSLVHCIILKPDYMKYKIDNRDKNWYRKGRITSFIEQNTGISLGTRIYHILTPGLGEWLPVKETLQLSCKPFLIFKGKVEYTSEEIDVKIPRRLLWFWWFI